MITMSLPPPHRNDLWDLERHVGWITLGMIGFSGFADRTETARAAWVAHVAMARLHARRGGSPTPDLGTPALTVVRDGDDERIAANDVAFATLITPTSPQAIADGWFGFEIAVPSPGDELAGRSAAHVIYHALRRSGTPWAARTDSIPTPPRRPTVLRAPWRLRDPHARGTPRLAHHALATQGGLR